MSIIAFKNLYELIKQVLADVRKISSKYRKSLYLEDALPALYDNIKQIHADYLTTFGNLKCQYWIGEISFQQLQQDLAQLQYVNKPIRTECVSRLDALLTEEWSNQAYSTIKAMRDYFDTTYRLNCSQLMSLKMRIAEIQKIQSDPGYDSDNLRRYIPYQSGFSETALMFRIIEYLNTSDNDRKEWLLGEIIRSDALWMDAADVKRILSAGHNPVAKHVVDRIMEGLITRLNISFSEITSCYEIFKMTQRI